MDDLKDMTNEKLNDLSDTIFMDLSKELGDKKSNLLLLMDIERELTIREE